MNMKTISKQSKKKTVKNEIKGKHLIINKPSIVALDFLLEFHTLNRQKILDTNWVFRYLLEWRLETSEQVCIGMALCKTKSYPISDSTETGWNKKERTKNIHSRPLLFFLVINHRAHWNCTVQYNRVNYAAFYFHWLKNFSFASNKRWHC